VICLDWRDRSHWNARKARCVHGCGGVTNLRDDSGKPSHKTCAERALTDRAERATRQTA
jgi:hypothetical protein